VSQATIVVTWEEDGGMVVDVAYIPLSDPQRPRALSLNLGGYRAV